MLAALRVRDLVLIEELDLELHRGFNVLTGETGAGKSILVSAMGLALGARGRAQLVRSSATGAEVEALFDIGDEPSVIERLVQAGWEDVEELLVRRYIPVEGRARCHINGHPVTLAMLESLSQGLAELSSQHEHHTLTDPSTHLLSLDAFARLESRRGEVTEAHGKVMRAYDDVLSLRKREQEQTQRDELLRYQLEQLRALAPERFEEAELKERRNVLMSAQRIMEAVRGGEEALYSGEGAVCETVTKVSEQIRGISAVDGSLVDLTAQLEEACALLEDGAEQLRRYADGFDDDPERLAFIEERLADHAKVRRLLGSPDIDLAEKLDLLEEELESRGTHDQQVAQAQERYEHELARAGKLASALSARRKTAARKLAKAFGRELKDLGMGGAKIEVRVERAHGGQPSIDGAHLSPHGVDRVEFLIAPNPGEPAGPLRSIASGGELSRAALALKRALAGVGPVGTYIFDEVDAGISGAVADMVGRKLREVSQHHQVLCVTHLPQVAALADAHYRVSKVRHKKRTVTKIVELDKEGRIEEVARMISGSEVTERSRAAAAELIGDTANR